MGFLGRRHALRRLLCWGAGVGVAGLLSIGGAQAGELVGVVHDAELPAQARTMERLILAGGPFVHPKDGVMFANREHRLPVMRRGYYHEYTVPTPGARNRGARRIICGGNQPTEPDACFYTEDHYNSFHRIVK